MTRADSTLVRRWCLRQIGDQDAAVVHPKREIEAGRKLAGDQPQLRRSRELPGLVENGRRGFGAKLFRVPAIFLLPEAARFRIGHAFALPEQFVGVEARQIDERRNGDAISAPQQRERESARVSAPTNQPTDA